MMDPSEHRKRGNPSAGIGAKLGGRNRNALLEALVRPVGVEIRDVLEKNGAQVSIAENDDVVETLAADAADKALTGSVHQWRTKRRLEDANARTLGDAVELGAELGVAIADDEARRRPERRELTELQAQRSRQPSR